MDRRTRTVFLVFIFGPALSAVAVSGCGGGDPPADRETLCRTGRVNEVRTVAVDLVDRRTRIRVSYRTAIGPEPCSIRIDPSTVPARVRVVETVPSAVWEALVPRCAEGELPPDLERLRVDRRPARRSSAPVVDPARRTSPQGCVEVPVAARRFGP